MTLPSPSNATVIISADQAAEYLSRMDISIAQVRDAIEAGEIAAGNVTKHHPVTAAGMSRWMHVVGGLRSRLSRGQWRDANPRNRPTSNHVKLPYTLSTVGANDATGLADHPSGPLAARRKGIGTAEAVTGTIPLITVAKLRKEQVRSSIGEEAPPAGNWFLLYHRDEDQVRMEVSLPSGFEDGQFTGWRVRVILPSWGQSDPAARKPLDGGGQDVDFRISEVS